MKAPTWLLIVLGVIALIVLNGLFSSPREGRRRHAQQQSAAPAKVETTAPAESGIPDRPHPILEQRAEEAREQRLCRYSRAEVAAYGLDALETYAIVCE